MISWFASNNEQDTFEVDIHKNVLTSYLIYYYSYPSILTAAASEPTSSTIPVQHGSESCVGKTLRQVQVRAGHHAVECPREQRRHHPILSAVSYRSS